MFELSPESIDEPSPLEALLELPRSAREDALDDFLATVADTVCSTAGFKTVVINLYRPAWDDYEAALVVGAPESVVALLGSHTRRASYSRIFADAEQPLPGVFMLTEESGFWNDLAEAFTPELTALDAPDAWRAGDGLIVFLNDSAGAPLAMFSMDEPSSGLRPGPEQLRLTHAICAHAELALEGAHRTEAGVENARILSLLLEASPAMTRCATAVEVLELAARIVVPELGFERFAGYIARKGELELAAVAGWTDATAPPERIPLDAVTTLLDDAQEQAGCFLGAAANLFPTPSAPWEERSRRNGRGLTAWHDHCLVVPCRGSDGELVGLVGIEDPVDRLLPSIDRRRAVRLLVDQVAAALVGVENRTRLNHLATHDALTGVRNRRGLDELVSARGEVAVLVCDLDHFKQINDRFGHARGDAVLSQFGGLLRGLARADDVAIRLGGEEFCLILPRTDRTGALGAAERLRQATMTQIAGAVPGGVTVSIGIATTAAGGVLDARRLLSAADHALYAAKAAGRNRTVLVDTDAPRSRS